VIYAALMVSAIVPSLLLLWYFHSRDLHPEPGKVLFASFFLGVATIPGVLLMAWAAIGSWTERRERRKS